MRRSCLLGLTCSCFWACWPPAGKRRTRRTPACRRPRPASPAGWRRWRGRSFWWPAWRRGRGKVMSMRVSLGQCPVAYQDPDQGAIRPGDRIQVGYGGTVEETFPARLGEVTGILVEASGFDDLVRLVPSGAGGPVGDGPRPQRRGGAAGPGPLSNPPVPRRTGSGGGGP